MTRLAYVFAAFLTALCCAPADANCRSRVVSRQVAVKRAVAVVNKVAVAAVLIPVAEVAAYSAVYGGSEGGYGASQRNDVGQRLATLEAKFDALIAALQQRPAPQQPAPVVGSVIGQHCAQCHSDGKRVLVRDGRLRDDLTPEQYADVIRRVESGDMPRGRKLTDGQKLAAVVEAALPGKK